MLPCLRKGRHSDGMFHCVIHVSSTSKPQSSLFSLPRLLFISASPHASLDEVADKPPCALSCSVLFSAERRPDFLDLSPTQRPRRFGLVMRIPRAMRPVSKKRSPIRVHDSTRRRHSTSILPFHLGGGALIAVSLISQCFPTTPLLWLVRRRWRFKPFLDSLSR